MKNLFYGRQIWRWSRLSFSRLFLLLGLNLAQMGGIALIILIFQEIDHSLPLGHDVLLSALRMVALGGMISLGFYFSRILSIQVALEAMTHLRMELFDFLCSRSVAFFTHQGSSSIHATILTDTERFQKFYEVLTGQILPAVMIGSGAIFLLFWLNPTLSIFLAVSVPLFLLVNYAILRPLSQQIAARARAFKTYSRELLSVISRFLIIRLQTAEDQERNRQVEFIRALKDTSYIYARQQALHLAFLNSMLLILIGIFLVIGGTQVSAQKLSLSNLLAYNVILVALRRYIQDAFSSLPALTDGFHALRTLGDLIATAPTEPYHGRKCYDVQESFSLRGVKFGYPSSSLVLDGVHLNLKRGSLSVITGPNGAGKTTIVNLLLGLYQPQEGMLFADNLPYTELDIRYLRKQMGVLLQDPWLFEGTVWENLVYGLPNADQEDVLAVSKFTSAHEFIEALADGYQSRIGERGIKLSGGQRQLIALTRVLIRRPKLLILDEPTNHLDPNAAQKLLRNLVDGLVPVLYSVSERPAILMITHDTTLACEADFVYALQDGRLTEEKRQINQKIHKILQSVEK